VVVALLLLAFAKKTILRQEAARQEAQAKRSEIVLIKDLSQSFISRIVVYKGSDEKNKMVVARDKDGNWILESKFGIRAKKDEVDNILNALKDIKGEVRSSDAALFGDFQIKDDQGLHILLEGDNGKPIKHIVVSFLSPAWNKSFVRLSDINQVLLVNKNIPGLFNLFEKDAQLNALFLADLKLLTFDPKQIRRIVIKQQKEGFALSKNPSEGIASVVWSFESARPEVADTVKVEEFLQNISNIYATDVMDPGLNTYGFDQPYLRILLEQEQGKIPLELDVGNYLQEENAYYVKVSSQSQVYKVSANHIHKLKVDKAFFLKPAQDIKETSTTPEKKYPSKKK